MNPESTLDGWFEEELNERRRQGLYRVRRRLSSAQGAKIVWRGREFLNFSSNDYLGLAADPRLARAASRAARKFGTGAGASALVSGHLPPLRALERDLAAWEGTEGALVFSSGFAANLAVISTLMGREDAIFSDELNHASLIDGCRLSRARIHVYRHADLDHLRHLLSHAGPARRRLIVSDTVFSMDGELAPLGDLFTLASRFEAPLLLDEAHATGVLGKNGRGLTECIPPGDLGATVLKVGTLSKALASQGGFVVGSRKLIAWLVNHARPYIFSTALAPPLAGTARTSVALVQNEPWRREILLSRAARLREKLQALGFNIAQSACHIIPVVVGEPQAALALSNRLQRQGLLVPAIRPPSVPEGTARLRISLTAGHMEEDLDHLVDALRVIV